MDPRRLENEDEEKFWEAWIKDELTFVYRYGKIGSTGHTKLKKFKTPAEALAELEAKLKEKLAEGFVEPGAEPAEDDEGEDGDESEGEAEKDEAGADPSDADDSEDDDESGDEDEDEDGQAADESGEAQVNVSKAPEKEGEADEEAADDEDEADEADDEDESEDEDEADEDDESDAPPAAKAAPPPVAAPPKPRLPERIRARAATIKDVEVAQQALTALAKSLPGRSWKVSQRARAARRALERLGGIDPRANASLAAVFDGLMGDVIVPKKHLSLDVALGLLWEVEAGAFAQTVRAWRAKCLSSPAQTAIGVLAAVVDAVPDPEVAVQVGAVLVERRLAPAAWERRFARVLPFLDESLAAKGLTAERLLAGLHPDGDAIVKSRVGQAGQVIRAARGGAAKKEATT